MSTREMAYSIFQQLSDEQLQGFIAMFKDFYPSGRIQNPAQSTEAKSSSALERLQHMIRPGTHEIDDKKSLKSTKWKSTEYECIN